jgi:hypothetical protein
MDDFFNSTVSTGVSRRFAPLLSGPARHASLGFGDAPASGGAAGPLLPEILPAPCVAVTQIAQTAKALNYEEIR